jgi:UDP-N-acetylmuramate dehydrogenase
MEKKIIEDFRNQFGKAIKINESLKKHTSIKVGGPAKLFYEAKDANELEIIGRCALEKDLPYIVIGNGTNIIFADAGFDGLIIKNLAGKIVFESHEGIVDSGMTLSRMIRRLAESNLGGLEFLAGIPGTLGGAIYGNAGAYGRNMADIIQGVILLDIDGKKVQISQADMNFQYRSSYLKDLAKMHHRDKMPVILSARIKVIPKTKEGILRVVEHYLKMRVRKYPHQPSAGSFFKNIIITPETQLPKKMSKEIKTFAVEGMIPAGLLIEKAGCKGVKVGGAQVSKEHANFLVNCGRAKAKDFKELTSLVKKRVKEVFDIDLEEEVEFIGDFDIKPRNILGKIFGR